MRVINFKGGGAYTADGDRVKMLISNNRTDLLARYYLGGQYEFDQTLGGTKEKLYLCGDGCGT